MYNFSILSSLKSICTREVRLRRLVQGEQSCALEPVGAETSEFRNELAVIVLIES
jgi:hypothetical protein